LLFTIDYRLFLTESSRALTSSTPSSAPVSCTPTSPFHFSPICHPELVEGSLSFPVCFQSSNLQSQIIPPEQNRNTQTPLCITILFAATVAM